MSDHLRRTAGSEAELLDTISFFDDSEASLDERRYFSITEGRRGKTGVHLEVRFSERTFDPPVSPVGSYQFPGQDSFSVGLERTLTNIIHDRGYRSIVSGIGGDEVLGGVPNGFPELADQLVCGRLGSFLRRGVEWSLPERATLIETSYKTIQYTMCLYARNDPNRRPIPAWLSKELAALATERKFMKELPKKIGVVPHRLENASTWWHIMETLPHLSPQMLFRPEYRYPMLDRDLVEFLFAIPPEQLVQPGRRRAMMRRALRGIVPQEILERRRKAFQLRAPMNAIRSAYPKLVRLMSSSIAAEMGLIDVERFLAELGRTANGNAQWYQAILRTIAYELWLRARIQVDRSMDANQQHDRHAMSSTILTV